MAHRRVIWVEAVRITVGINVERSTCGQDGPGPANRHQQSSR